MSEGLIDKLIEQDYLKSPLIIEAFRKIKRADFVSEKIIEEKGKEWAGNYNAPLPIGQGQTISQPLTVAFMLELLEPKPGNKILDIGSGSGWQTALLCQIVGERGFVCAIEIIPELKELGEKNVSKYNFKNAEFICGDGSQGLVAQAPFDKIIAAASAQEIPVAWKEQLKVGGRLVAPVKNSIWLLIKKGENQFEEKEYPGFVFVPLV
ncbi:MAG: protein-L-isoaspartate O-methyltransferase [Patescibacteria group bacterium]